MGKIEGFLEYEREEGRNRPVQERLKDYREVHVPLVGDSVSTQGARCMDCGIPFCHVMGCPVYNLIPEWNDAVYRGQWREAYERLDMTNNFPEITGRVCPAPCEASCTLSINSAPVTIKEIELSIIERAFEEGWVVPRPPHIESGKKVAVIGSGPGGMAAAQQLRRMGHTVTLFEKDPKIGGILRYGIPDFKLEKWVIDRRLKQMNAEGVRFETGVDFGKDISAKELKKSFDAILITMGAGQPRDLPVPGRELGGIHFAMDYLIRSNKWIAGEISEREVITAKGKNVLVIGGGDTGSDCVGTANRQGATKIYQFEILPKPIEWEKSWNPAWPNWPGILRSSSSHEEGCERDWAIHTAEFSGKEGNVETGHFCRVEWKNLSGDGRPKMHKIEGSEFTLQIDLVLLAMGFVHVEHNKFLSDLGVQYDQRGNVTVNKKYMSSVKGVFAAGDTVKGASLVVHAIRQGREAASGMDEFLRS